MDHYNEGSFDSVVADYKSHCVRCKGLFQLGVSVMDLKREGGAFFMMHSLALCLIFSTSLSLMASRYAPESTNFDIVEFDR